MIRSDESGKGHACWREDIHLEGAKQYGVAVKTESWNILTETCYLQLKDISGKKISKNHNKKIVAVYKEVHARCS